MKHQTITNAAKKKDELSAAGLQRRKFLSSLGATASVITIAAACNKDADPADSVYNVNNSSTTIDLGSGDVGILNYAYALEQLEAAFYTQVIATPYTGITPDETALLTNIRDHEVAHREFFKTALGAKAIPALEVNFSAIDFTSRASVLGTAKAFEDLGVSAYNGAGKLIVNPDYLVLAGKIVSVEARHAAYIRDLVSDGSFADSSILDANGLDKEKNPSDVLNTASAFLKSKLSGKNLPTS